MSQPDSKPHYLTLFLPKSSQDATNVKYSLGKDFSFQKCFKIFWRVFVLVAAAFSVLENNGAKRKGASKNGKAN